MSVPRSICLLSLTSPVTVTPGSGEDGHQLKPLSEPKNRGACDRLVYTAVAQQIFVELEHFFFTGVEGQLESGPRVRAVIWALT